MSSKQSPVLGCDVDKKSYGARYYSELVSVSLMKTGNMLIKGLSNEKEALLVYDTVMTTVSS